MKKSQRMVLSHESVKEALQEYLNRHLIDSAKMVVTSWEEIGSNIQIEFVPESETASNG